MYDYSGLGLGDEFKHRLFMITIVTMLWFAVVLSYFDVFWTGLIGEQVLLVNWEVRGKWDGDAPRRYELAKAFQDCLTTSSRADTDTSHGLRGITI